MARRFSLGEIISSREFAFSKWMEEVDSKILAQLRRKEKPTWNHNADIGSTFKADTKTEAEKDQANLVSSKATDKEGYHYPIIDCDYPIAVVQSRTPGHYHLFIEKAVPHAAYMHLLQAMYDAGLIGKGNLKQMDHGGATFARIGPYNTILQEQQDDLDEEIRRTLDWDKL